MAKRFSDTERWKRGFIRGLKAEYKLLWFYILDACDIAGLWYVDIEVAQIYIGTPIDKGEALRVFNEGELRVVEVDSGGKWFIPSFIEVQYGTQLSKTNNIFKSISFWITTMFCF